ncbi:nuclear transport factor 2 family protein [Streptacidiphilus sp. 4-A2]|nr:nuclear transport factor 2 family protein [Streptacidiphilus sp. 4-A2]
MTDSATYFEIQQFYAVQMQSLDGGAAQEFADTFTVDGSFVHYPHKRVDGRAAIAAATEQGVERTRLAGVVRRHWFGLPVIEQTDKDTLRVRYSAVTSVTTADGTVTHEPTCMVEDILVRQDNRLLNHIRTVHRDDVKDN